MKNTLIKTPIIKTIELYQKTLSPDHGILKARYPYGFCRHYPSCSEYAKQAIIHRGVVVGSFKSAGRILRCNPFVAPSVDTSYLKGVYHG